jgi:hypothetical protein
VEIRIELDPRCYEPDPEAVEYYLKNQIEKLDEATVKEMQSKASQFIDQRLRFIFEPNGVKIPTFNWEIRKIGDEAWDDPDAETVFVASWKFQLEGEKSYQLQALKMGENSKGIPLNVVFVNYLNGVQAERYAVLFPGETSFALDLQHGLENESSGKPAGVAASSGDWISLFTSEIKRGFLHVIPLGLDHILFVLGMFLMTRKWKPLLLQVSAFTIAHTLTLWIASAGWVNLSPKIVEPIIAASIVVVAIENIFQSKYSHWRLLIVFVFGLIHGLGFAGVMATKLDSTASLLVGLLGINIGVEIGQICVIAVGLILTAWIARDTKIYRKYVVISGSILIALAGIWWVIERTVL